MKSSPSPQLSIILPCYRTGVLAMASAAHLQEVLSARGESFEVLVVDDGGGDLVNGPWCDGVQVRLLALPDNAGKGAAVRTGMLAARGRVRLFTDADLPYGVEPLLLAAELILQRGFHMVIGDRTLPGSRYAEDLGWRRRLASRVFSSLVGRVVTGGFFDTQCGLKAFRADIAEELFRRGRVERFAFDVELVYMALIHHLDIKRIPVRLRANETSSVRLVVDSLQMLGDLGRMGWARYRGLYHSPALDELARRELEELTRGKRGIRGE